MHEIKLLIFFSTGSRVKTDCTEFRSTSCLPCLEGTYMNQPTGLKDCFPCTNCNTDPGLKIKTSCTSTSDTVCEPLEGFYCMDVKDKGCEAAQRHRHCEPGQYITEYQTGNECCPMCPPGSCVKTNCTEFRSRSCLPCLEGTYMNQPTERTQCFPCTNCDAGSGLKIKTSCTSTSDTVCEPLEGFYCMDVKDKCCMAAQRHKHCEPGQYISKKGTASTDTECSDCTDGTFSNGTFTSCQPHT
uniref:TNFR-Cys domain-containing protein n=1 Tax=Lates calcarifer TaxID=8187 RepID=A0A4W6D468_LATCA